MIGVQNLTGFFDVFIDPAGFFPRHRGHPVQIIADHSGFCAHRAHAAQFFQLDFCLFTGFFRQAGRFNLFAQLVQLILAVLTLTQLALNRFHLFIQIIFALGFFHLALNAVANPFFNLQNPNFAFHHAVNQLKTLSHISCFQQLLLFRYLDRQMRGDGVSNFACIFYLIDRHHNLRSNFLVQLDIMFKLLNGRPAKGNHFRVSNIRVSTFYRLTCHEITNINQLLNPGSGNPFNQDFHSAIRQF